MFECNIDISENSKANSVPTESIQKSLPFYITNCGEFHAGDKYFTKRDGLDNYLVIITEKGHGKMAIDGQSCILNPGSAVIIDCRKFQEYGTVPGEAWSFHYIHFKAASIEGYRNVLLENLTPVSLRSPATVISFMQELYSLSYSSDEKSYIISSNLISNILTEMVCSLSDSGSSRLQREDIDSLQNYIRSNYKNELHIDDFVSHTKLSRYYLIHTFKKLTGFSPCRYMHMCRTEYAQTLLVTTNMTVSQIAEAVGYNSTAVFIRHFRALNKTSPGEYRKNFLHNIP